MSKKKGTSFRDALQQTVRMARSYPADTNIKWLMNHVAQTVAKDYPLEDGSPVLLCQDCWYYPCVVWKACKVTRKIIKKKCPLLKSRSSTT